MAASLRDQIIAAVRTQPEEARTLAERDLEWLEAHTSLTLSHLAKLISDPEADAKGRAIAAWVAGLLHEKSLIPVLEEVARSRPPEEVLWDVAKALCALNHGGALFREILNASSDGASRRVAAYALGCLREKSAVNDLCRLLNDQREPPTLRGQAAEALGYLADKGSLPYLLDAGRDSSPEVRFWAAFALGHLGGAEAEAILEEMAGNDHTSVEGWWEISREATAALESIRSQRR